MTNATQMPPYMPPWIKQVALETSSGIAFTTGAALAHFTTVFACNSSVQSLFRTRMALWAAENTMVHMGRRERASELRDVLHFSSGALGPAGAVYALWLGAVQPPLSVKGLGAQLPAELHDLIPMALSRGATPVAQAAAILNAAYAPHLRLHALLLADAALSHGLGLRHLTPLLAPALKRSDLSELACYHAALKGALHMVPLMADLARRHETFTHARAKIRTKGAKDALNMFTQHEALTPRMLPLPERAAHRLCDRLVELGAAHELTGRPRYRLYGIAP